MQTRRQSLIETATNTSVGCLGAFIIIWTCIKCISEPEIAALTATTVCTVWSLIRGYAIRRYFASRKG